MRNNSKHIRIIIILIIGLFIITGCVGEDEINKQTKKYSKLKTELKLEQISDKEFTITVQNGKKKNTKSGTIFLDEGEEIYEEYSFLGSKEATVYLIPKGKTKKDALMYGTLNGEGNSQSMEIPSGEYEVLLEVKDDSLTGTINVKAIKSN